MTAKRTATKPRQAKQQPPELITVVEIVRSDNHAVPIRSFATLWDADRALAQAFAQESPPPAPRHHNVEFSVFWADGKSHEGTADVSRAIVATAPARGGILRAHLLDTARWWGSDDFVRHFTGRKPGEEIAAQHAWGQDLDWRLAYDLARQAHEAPPAHRRNGDRSSASRRAATKPAASSVARSAPEKPPTIKSVRFLFSENGIVPRRTFRTLWAADRALSTAISAAPRDDDGGAYKTDFIVEWTDGWKHQGPIRVSHAAADATQGRGMLRTYLEKWAVWLRSEHFVSYWTNFKSSDEIAEMQAWGVELAARLERDLAAQLEANARRDSEGGP